MFQTETKLRELAHELEHRQAHYARQMLRRTNLKARSELAVHASNVEALYRILVARYTREARGMPVPAFTRMELEHIVTQLKQELERRRTALERAALAEQMNPHKAARKVRILEAVLLDFEGLLDDARSTR